MVGEHQVYVKTFSGKEEMLAQYQGILPQEARTLLILINGTKNYGQLMKSLNDRKLFKEAGAFQQHFALLQGLKYIKLKDDSPQESSKLVDFTERREAIVLEKDDYGMGTMLISAQS